jgi:hypothetical protein
MATIFASYRNTPLDRLKFARNTIIALKNSREKDIHAELMLPVWRSKRQISDKDFAEAGKILECLEQSTEWRVRVESSNYLTIYTSDEVLIDGLSVDCGALEIYKPDSNLTNFLQSNFDIAIVKKVPEYEFKVYLKGTGRVDINFSNWLEANTDKSKVGSATLRNIKNGWYSGGNYFYIKNEKILTMVRMLVGHNIRRIEKQIYKGDIDKYKHDNQ